MKLEDITKSTGTYVQVIPDSRLDILDLIVPNMVDDLHLTLLYADKSPIKPEYYDLCDPDLKFSGIFEELEYWSGHDNVGYLVMKINSPELMKRHRYWVEHVGNHSFKDYSPHITLVTPVDYNEQTKALISEFNKFIDSPDTDTIVVWFSKESIEPLKD